MLNTRTLMTNNMETRQVIISGKVQAVGFRNWVKKTCENLFLEGNVRNTVDMRVEVMVTGHKFNLDWFCWLCKKGPVLAKVEDVKIKCVDLKEFGSFNTYIWQFTDGKVIHNRYQHLSEIPTTTPLSDKMSKDLKARGFKFVGSTICYAFMQASGLVNDHTIHCFRYQEIQKISFDK